MIDVLITIQVLTTLQMTTITFWKTVWQNHTKLKIFIHWPW